MNRRKADGASIHNRRLTIKALPWSRASEDRKSYGRYANQILVDRIHKA